MDTLEQAMIKMATSACRDYNRELFLEESP